MAERERTVEQNTQIFFRKKKKNEEGKRAREFSALYLECAIGQCILEKHITHCSNIVALRFYLCISSPALSALAN